MNVEEGLKVKSCTTPAEMVDEWPPHEHTAFANLKSFLLGTFQGVSTPEMQK